MQLLLCGFHRSGTSLLGQILSTAGLSLGEKLLGSSPSNPYGHFEDINIVKLHDSLLAKNGLDWRVGLGLAINVDEEDQLLMAKYASKRAGEIWGVKDPRLCLFVNEWKEILPNSKFILLFRDPYSTTNSLLKRQSRDILLGLGNREKHIEFWQHPMLAYEMWIRHNQNLIEFYNNNNSRCIAITHQQLIGKTKITQIINDRFGFKFDATLDQTEIVDSEAYSNIDNIDSVPMPTTKVQNLLQSAMRDITKITGDTNFEHLKCKSFWE